MIHALAHFVARWAWRHIGGLDGRTLGHAQFFDGRGRGHPLRCLGGLDPALFKNAQAIAGPTELGI
jgi:hypothetical protein